MRAPQPAHTQPCNALCVALDHNTAQKSFAQAKCVTGTTPCTRSALASLRRAHDTNRLACKQGLAKALRRANTVNDRKSTNSSWTQTCPHLSLNCSCCPDTELTALQYGNCRAGVFLWHRRVLRITPIATPTGSAPLHAYAATTAPPGLSTRTPHACTQICTLTTAPTAPAPHTPSPALTTDFAALAPHT